MLRCFIARGFNFARNVNIKRCISVPVEGSHIYQIVLTGGPCGGKSTAMTRLSSRLNEIGYQALVLPEIPTLFNQCGAIFNPEMAKEELLTYEASVIKAQMSLEENFMQIAKVSKKPTVILCDRGTVDVRAYLNNEDWKLLLDMEGWNLSSLRDRRYDAVFHLVTAAIGAEKFYTLSNNAARRETPEEARKLDYSIRDAWLGHPSLRVITNELDFEAKIGKLVDGVLGVIGLPKPKHHERRWVIPSEIGYKIWHSAEFAKRKNFQDFEIICHYLQSDAHSQKRITKRSQFGESSYFYTIRNENPQDPTMINTTAQRISARHYMFLLDQVDKKSLPVCKTVSNIHEY